MDEEAEEEAEEAEAEGEEDGGSSRLRSFGAVGLSGSPSARRFRPPWVGARLKLYRVTVVVANGDG